jgi:hypothetical protein
MLMQGVGVHRGPHASTTLATMNPSCRRLVYTPGHVPSNRNINRRSESFDYNLVTAKILAVTRIRAHIKGRMQLWEHEELKNSEQTTYSNSKSHSRQALRIRHGRNPPHSTLQAPTV